MGQSLLDGHLPYTELWDNKPPLLFVIFAAIIAIAGKNILVIRIIGSLFVAGTSFLIYQTGKYLDRNSTGLIAAILFIILTGEMGGQAVMSEVIAVLPLTASFLLMIRSQRKYFRFNTDFLVGFLLAIATLIRLNLAYLDLLMFFYYLALKKINPLKNFIVGIIIPPIMMTIPYLITDNLLLFYRSFIEAPWNYSQSKLSILAIIHQFFTEGLWGENLLLLLFWLGSFFGILIIIFRIIFNSSLSKESRKNFILLLLWLMAISFSIISIGRNYPHYLIQVLPFMVILQAIFLCSDFLSKIRYGLFFILSLGIFNSLGTIVEQYRSVLGTSNKMIYQQDIGYQLANFLEKANPDQQLIYLTDYQIVYWLTQTKPITKMVTHPSNISETSLLKVIRGKEATPESEMKKILSKKPLFIVKKNEVSYLVSQPKARGLLSMTLRQKYQLVAQIEDFYIYRRK